MLIGRNLDFISDTNVKKKLLDLNSSNFDYQEIIDYNPDVFVHLAWEGLPDHSEEVSKKNYFNSMRIFKMIINSTSCSKIISTGSCWEYNDGNIYGECREDFKINPQTPFSIYKNKIFNEVFDITKKKKITFNWLRLFYVYGLGQKKTSIIPMLIDSIKNKKKININYPFNINDYINVSDVSKIIDCFITKNLSSGVYNLGSGKGVEVKKLLEIIDKNINGNNALTAEYLAKVEEKVKIQNFYASTEKINKYIMNLELIDIKTGIKNLIKSF
jgi:nucleoside-diphosphate-sugar epimerase